MSGDGQDGQAANRPGRRAANRGLRVAAPAPKKRKRSVMLSEEADKRLAIHAVQLGMDASELVEMLVSTHLRRFVVQDRGKWNPAEAADGVDPAVETLPVGEGIGPSPADGEAPGAGGGEGRDEGRPGGRRRRAG